VLYDSLNFFENRQFWFFRYFRIPKSNFGFSSLGAKLKLKNHQFQIGMKTLIL
jgi:hypothetical protein